MSKPDNQDLETWDIWDLPPIGEMNNVSHDDDFVPTPNGQVRCYFNGELMRSLLECEFSVGFDNEPGEPHAFVFQAPVAMWPDEEPPEPALETIMTEDEIPIVEREHDDPRKRRFEPTDAVSWDFEIVVETTPYDPEP